MKALNFTLLFVAILNLTISAQTVLYEQDFEGISLIPEDITLINADEFLAYDAEDAVFNDSAWIIGTTSRTEFAGTQIAIACSYYENYDVPADDWMILPAITIGANAELTWDAMSLTSSGNYPDEYQVLIVPAIADGTPTADYFGTDGEILFQVLESSSASVATLGDGLSQRSLNLKDEGYTNQTVWIAFRLVTGGDGGSYIGIDNIVVTDLATSVFELTDNSSNLTVYPNPANVLAKASFTIDKTSDCSISVFDIAGRMITEQKFYGVGAGNHVCDINVSDIETGTYIVAFISNGRTTTQKLVIQ